MSKTPPVRTEGDTVIVPIMEEILVTETRLILKEELRIQIKKTVQAEAHTVHLRREIATIEQARQSRRHRQEPSMSYSSDNNLNQAAAHDTGLYDPDLHDNQIVAMYDTDAQAQAAKAQLVASGFSAAAIQVVSRGTETGTLGGVNAEDANGGVWGAIRSMFVPDEDRAGYTHAIGRGHAVLVVNPDRSMDRSKLIHTLEATNPVDFDAKLEGVAPVRLRRNPGSSGIHEHRRRGRHRHGGDGCGRHADRDPYRAGYRDQGQRDLHRHRGHRDWPGHHQADGGEAPRRQA